MGSESKVATAIVAFDQWRLPGTFHEVVSRSLDEEDKSLFETIWNEAADSAHWRDGDLVACTAIAAAALRERFGSLDPAAVKSLVRAASYIWR